MIGLLLAVVAIFLAREAKGLLIGEAADPELVEGLRALASGKPGVVGVGHVLTVHSAPDQVTVMINVDFRDDMLAGEVERIVDETERDARSRWPVIRRLFIRPMQGAANERNK
jgi:divalent metal cation (Fe/Co/Zn/Cd) transporter